ncbi:MAG: hypothetical protein HY901_35970, partial [Deltaproteobacteria bacterium]|nr:hypothetical protein [Deltaproteobacteria bacterium]
EIEPAPKWEWPRLHLLAGRPFADPFLGPELYPELSAGTLITAESLRPSGEIAYTSWIDLQIYLLEVKIPLINRIDGGEPGAENVRVNLKFPYAIPGHESHRLMLVAGAVVQDSTPAISRSSSAQVIYGYGGHGFTAQLRGGYGYDQFAPSQRLRLGLLYGALLGYRAGPIQPMVEFDAMRTSATQSDRFTLVPALRIFPGREDTVQIGLGGLLSFSHGEDTPGRRFGAVFDVTYNFL